MQSRCHAGVGGPSLSCCCSRWRWSLFAYSAVGLGLRGKFPPGLPTYVIVFAAASCSRAHLAVRRFAPYADPLLLPLAALLNGLGLVMIYRLQSVRPERQPRQPGLTECHLGDVYQLSVTAVGIVADRLCSP